MGNEIHILTAYQLFREKTELELVVLKEGDEM